MQLHRLGVFTKVHTRVAAYPARCQNLVCLPNSKLSADASLRHTSLAAPLQVITISCPAQRLRDCGLGLRAS